MIDKIKIQIVCLLLSVIVVGNSRAEIPKESRKDQYLIKLSDALEKKDWQNSEKYIRKLELLNIKLPNDFYYYKGETAYFNKNYIEAIHSITEYINRAGNKGKLYKQSLRILDASEDTPAYKEVQIQLENFRKQQKLAIKIKNEKDRKFKKCQKISKILEDNVIKILMQPRGDDSYYYFQPYIQGWDANAVKFHSNYNSIGGARFEGSEYQQKLCNILSTLTTCASWLEVGDGSVPSGTINIGGRVSNVYGTVLTTRFQTRNLKVSTVQGSTLRGLNVEGKEVNKKWAALELLKSNNVVKSVILLCDEGGW